MADHFSTLAVLQHWAIVSLAERTVELCVCSLTLIILEIHPPGYLQKTLVAVMRISPVYVPGHFIGQARTTSVTVISPFATLTSRNFGHRNLSPVLQRLKQRVCFPDVRQGILVDSNVILDVFIDDPNWAAWSESKLEK